MDGCLHLGMRRGAALLLVAALTGCSGGGTGGSSTTDGSTGSDTSTSSTSSMSSETFSTPTTEDVNPTTGQTGSNSATPIVSLPSLPIGGAAAPDPKDPSRQCVGISWIATTDANPVIPPGYAVEVTGARFSTKGYTVVTSGCGSDSPNCLGYVLRKGKDHCDLAVRTLPSASPDAGATVGLKGILYCPQSVGKKRCGDFAAAVAKEPGVAIELIEPSAATDSGTESGTTTQTTGGG